MPECVILPRKLHGDGDHTLFICQPYLSEAICLAQAVPFRAAVAKVSDVTVEVVILAMIAAFLGLRLYSVLGRRAEHEEETIQGRIDGKRELGADSGASVPRNVTPRASDRAEPGNAAARPRELPGVLPVAERGLRDIAAADRRFDALFFLQGAKAAYRMVLEAFWKGDKDELALLCDRDVYDGFAAAIDARNAAGETLDNRLVRIEDATVVDAGVEGTVARITVRFTADIAAVTRDAAGVVIAGSLHDAIEARDIWTFRRDLTLEGPDWLLDETDEA